MFVNAEDIARRLLRRRPHWPRKPTVRVIGEQGLFGDLVFDFGDEEIRYSIFLKDKEYIQRTAQTAVNQFNALAKRIWEDRC